MRVMMVGTGYVGLTTGICFAEMGHSVICYDIDKSKVEKLLRNELPIYEPGLEKALIRNREREQLFFSSNLNEAIGFEPDIVFICVDTPPNVKTGEANLEHVYSAAQKIAEALIGSDRFTVFVNKSTVPVGTAATVQRIISEIIPKENFAVASNPEFLREGSAIFDFMNPDRVVVGSSSERARRLLEDLYKPLTRAGHALVMTRTVETAELIKYSANGFLATKVAFINELALLCEKAGADIEELALGIGLDNRIGRSFLSPGPGYGGSCFPKDTSALAATARSMGSPATIIETVIKSNTQHKKKMVEKTEQIVGNLEGKSIAVLGLTFKANTDDMREAASLTIIPELQNRGAAVTTYDPIAADTASMMLPNVNRAASIEEALTGADAALILTEWDEFRHSNWSKLASLMKTPQLIDLRNLFNPVQIKAMGLDYYSLGRG